ncbi:MAG: hypothetical protein RIR79_1657 [Pseudomonadota bacterium]|jgi:acetate kinase
MSILTINAGSSSLKFAVYPLLNGSAQPSIFSGCIEGLEPGGTSATSFSQALINLHELLASRTDLPPLKAVAHRVVHGGSVYRRSVIVTDAILADLERFNPLAPLHQPHNLAGIRAFAEAFSELPQVACFDTAFHTTIPTVAAAFALPQALTQQGIRRYGFHGLSYQYIMGSLQQQSHRAQGRVLMAHLGNGASLCAALEGKSCATTMGFSAVDGLMMGTRCGTLDAGVLLHLLEQGWTHDRIQSLVYKQSGLLGVSGSSADMRNLRADPSPSAKEAIELFTHRVVRESGAMIASMGGLDVLAFSGGIGEHDAQLRYDVCQSLAWLGIEINAERNQAAKGDAITHLHTPQSRIEVWLIPTDEGSVAAREAAELIL